MTDNENAAGIADAKPRGRAFSGCGCITAAVGVLFVVVLLLSSWDFGAPRAARRMQCINNLHLIGLAMQHYEAVNGCLPPAYTTDQAGHPLHSWRLLLLPYLEQRDLYEKIRLDEPWDSPHNRSVLQDNDLSLLFHCPSARNPKAETSYVMVVGPNTISDGPHSVRYKDCTDGLSRTIMIVEVKDS